MECYEWWFHNSRRFLRNLQKYPDFKTVNKDLSILECVLWKRDEFHHSYFQTSLFTSFLATTKRDEAKNSRAAIQKVMRGHNFGCLRRARLQSILKRLSGSSSEYWLLSISTHSFSGSDLCKSISLCLLILAPQKISWIFEKKAGEILKRTDNM